MNKSQCYKILGLKHGATKEQIKTAYRKLAMEFHPDRNDSPDAQKAFVLISFAYELLYNDDTPVNESINSSEDYFDKWKNVNVPPKNPIEFNQWKKVKAKQAKTNREKEREEAKNRFYQQKEYFQNSKIFYPIKFLYFIVMVLLYSLPISLFIFGIVYAVYDESWAITFSLVLIMTLLAILFILAIRYIHLEFKRYFI